VVGGVLDVVRHLAKAGMLQQMQVRKVLGVDMRTLQPSLYQSEVIKVSLKLSIYERSSSVCVYVCKVRCKIETAAGGVLRQ
jgi:hypothetical protein